MIPFICVILGCLGALFVDRIQHEGCTITYDLLKVQVYGITVLAIPHNIRFNWRKPK